MGVFIVLIAVGVALFLLGVFLIFRSRQKRFLDEMDNSSAPVDPPRLEESEPSLAAEAEHPLDEAFRKMGMVDDEDDDSSAGHRSEPKK